MFDEGNNISRSGSMSKDNGCEIKFNICGYFPASENPGEIAEQRVMCQLGSIGCTSQYLGMGNCSFKIIYYCNHFYVTFALYILYIFQIIHHRVMFSTLLKRFSPLKECVQGTNATGKGLVLIV